MGRLRNAVGCMDIFMWPRMAPSGCPVGHCGGVQGGATSTDGGTTWNEFLVTNSRSQINGADPSVAIDSNNTAYFCYVNNEPVRLTAHLRVMFMLRSARTADKRGFAMLILVRRTESRTLRIPRQSAERGPRSLWLYRTNQGADYQASGFPGKWYAFIATTYDEGQTWTVTVNATPNDPVQSNTGVWQQGGSHDDRNLLDFNEITVDDRRTGSLWIQRRMRDRRLHRRHTPNDFRGIHASGASNRRQDPCSLILIL